MDEKKIADALKACLANSEFSKERQQAVFREIRGEHVKMNRKISVSLVFAIVLILAIGGMAIAAGIGLFGRFSEDEMSYNKNVRLEHLEDSSQVIDESVKVTAPENAQEPQEALTLYEEITAGQGGRTFDLTLNQVYCDGYKLYYTYTLKTNRMDITYGEGRPSGFDTWMMEEPGSRMADVWWIEPEETFTQICEWLDGGAQRYVIMDAVGIGDGADIDDGSEHGIPTMIYDSGSEWTDELTLTGYQEVELPQAYAPGDTFDILLTVMYGTSVFYQDETGVYWDHVSQSENRGIIKVPFTVSVQGSAQEFTGTLQTNDYTATAHLTVSDVSVYGEVVFDAQDWVERFNADWTQADASEPEWITSYTLLAGEEELKNIGGGYGVNPDGQFIVMVEFDLPQDLQNLSLQPEEANRAAERISLQQATAQ